MLDGSMRDSVNVVTSVRLFGDNTETNESDTVLIVCSFSGTETTEKCAILFVGSVRCI